MKKYPVVRKKIPEKIYKEVHRSFPMVWVDVVVTDGKNFLLTKRVNEPLKGKWWIQGGRLFKNELLREAVARFMKRETGLRGKVEKFLGFHEFFQSPGYFPGINAHGIAFVFLVRIPKKSKLRLDDQHSSARWFSGIDPSWHSYVKKFLRKAGFK